MVVIDAPRARVRKQDSQSVDVLIEAQADKRVAGDAEKCLVDPAPLVGSNAPDEKSKGSDSDASKRSPEFAIVSHGERDYEIPVIQEDAAQGDAEP